MADSLDELIEQLEANEALPLCPYDKRSPDYWTTPDDDPCKICGQINDLNAPNLCRGADTRLFKLAASRLASIRDALETERLARKLAKFSAIAELESWSGSPPSADAVSRRIDATWQDFVPRAQAIRSSALGEEG